MLRPVRFGLFLLEISGLFSIVFPIWVALFARDSMPFLNERKVRLLQRGGR